MSSVEEITISSLSQRLQKVFDLPSAPLECSTDDRVHLAQRRSEEAGKSIAYPVLAYSLDSWEPQQWHNPTVSAFAALRTHGEGPDFHNAIRLFPVQLSFDVTYLDDDYVRVVRFLSRWTVVAASGLLNFRLRVDGFPIDIQVRLESSLSVPKKDIGPQTSSQYEFTGRMVVSSCVSGPFDSELLKLVRVKETTIGFLASDVAPLRGEPGLVKSPEQLEASLAEYSQEDRDSNLMFELLLDRTGVKHVESST